jgi:hypothetical protein
MTAAARHAVLGVKCHCSRALDDGLLDRALDKMSRAPHSLGV